jgi:hypothetical protein
MCSEASDSSESTLPVEKDWQSTKPSMRQEGEAQYAHRAATYVNRRHATQQVAVPSSDVVAVAIPRKHGAALILSVYDVKFTDGHTANELQLRAKLQIIKHTYDDVKSGGMRGHVDLLLCADFNRHCVLQGGVQALGVGEPGRTDEAEAIVDLMQENTLTSLLSPGTVI